MADETPRPQDEDVPTPHEDVGADVPEEDGLLEEEARPRREASAEFLVDAEVGSEATLREAMDPANQSLREALRLSYRVLQVVILVLVVVFVFSGFTRVEPQQSGVMLRFGRIMGAEGQQALAPGPAFSVFPYPAGEFVLFRDKNRGVDLGRAFWPDLRDEDFDRAVESATTNRLLRPGPNRQGRGDGSLLTAGGDIAHMKLRAEYEIEDPVAFVRAAANDRNETTDGAYGDRLVRLALMRSAVHTAAKVDVETFVAFGEQEEADLRGEAQSLLDRLDTGIRVGELDTPLAPTEALAIRKASQDLQETIRQNEQVVESARQAAQATLIRTAGSDYGELLRLINRYEQAADLDDEAAEAEILAQINTRLEDSRNAGEIANVIQRAKAHRSFIESTLGQKAQRFAGLAPSFRDNPQLVVDRLWAAVYGSVVSKGDTEIIQVPPGVNNFLVRLSGNEDVSKVRRNARLQAREAETGRRIGTLDIPYLQGAQDMRLEGAGRILTEDAEAIDN